MAAIDINTITTMMAVAGPVGSVFVLGWWLSGRFRRQELAQRDRMDELADAQRKQLATHEDRDQERHEENLERFRTLSVSVAQLGASNGSAKGR